MTVVLNRESRGEAARGGFVPIAVATLLPSLNLAFDLFTKPLRGGRCVLYRERSVPLTQDSILALLDNGTETLYLRFEDKDAYGAHLHASLGGNTTLSDTQRYQILNAATKSIFCDAFNGNRVSSIVHAVSGIAEQLVACFSSEQIVLRELYSLMTHDYCTYTHANNVATYCVAIAKAMGNNSRRDLSAIAGGALLHDIGKRHLPAAILNKPERLTDEEKIFVRRHPQLGFQDLCRNEDLSWGQLMMVYQHHERLNGSGYPVRIAGDEIHPWAKICAVADVFDATTSDRPHRRARPISEALGFLQKRTDSMFDFETVQCLTELLSQS